MNAPQWSEKDLEAMREAVLKDEIRKAGEFNPSLIEDSMGERRCKTCGKLLGQHEYGHCFGCKAEGQDFRP